MVRTKIVEDNGGYPSTDLHLQKDFQGHLKVKLIFLNRNPYF